VLRRRRRRKRRRRRRRALAFGMARVSEPRPSAVCLAI